MRWTTPRCLPPIASPTPSSSWRAGRTAGAASTTCSGTAAPEGALAPSTSSRDRQLDGLAHLCVVPVHRAVQLALPLAVDDEVALRQLSRAVAVRRLPVGIEEDVVAAGQLLRFCHVVLHRALDDAEGRLPGAG